MELDLRPPRRWCAVAAEGRKARPAMTPMISPDSRTRSFSKCRTPSGHARGGHRVRADHRPLALVQLVRRRDASRGWRQRPRADLPFDMMPNPSTADGSATTQRSGSARATLSAHRGLRGILVANLFTRLRTPRATRASHSSRRGDLSRVCVRRGGIPPTCSECKVLVFAWAPCQRSLRAGRSLDRVRVWAAASAGSSRWRSA